MRTDNFTRGEILAGKYLVDRVVGIGGVGLVVAARHIELDETVALKFLLPEMQQRPDIVARFAQEAKAAVRIKSEYAARVFDVGVMPGRGPYLVMEYLEGSNLADVIETNGPMAVKRAVAFVLEVCEALAVAHSYGIIHRDIKPENIFLSRRNDGTEVAKILDFGISKAALAGFDTDALFKTQSLMGTPLYMSPEQIRSSSNVDERSDIWSLGVVFYEMLTGRLPFDGDTIPKICSQVLEEQPLPIGQFAIVPDGIRAVLERCFQKDPTKRFQNVAELAIALLPFGPIKSRVSAERTSTILEASGKSSGITFRFDSAAPGPPSSTDPTLNVPSIPSAPIAPSFSRPPSVITSAFPGVNSSIPSSSPEAMAQFAKESARTRRTIIAAGIVVIGVVGAGASFMIGAVKGSNGKDSAPQQLVVSVAPQSVPVPQPVLDKESAPVGGSVTVSLGATPPEARVFLDDQLVMNPLKKSFPRDGKPHSVRAESFNYVTRSVAVTFDSDKEIVLALDRLPTTTFVPVTRNTPAKGGAPASSPAAAPPAQAAAPPPVSSPAAPAAPATKPMGEVELPKTKKPVRPLDTSQPW